MSDYKAYKLDSSNLIRSLAQFWHNNLKNLKNEALGRIIRTDQGEFYVVYNIQGRQGGRNEKEKAVSFALNYLKKTRDQITVITDVHSHPTEGYQFAEAILSDHYPSHADFRWTPQVASILLTSKYILFYNLKRDQKKHSSAIRFSHEKRRGTVVIRNKDRFSVFLESKEVASKEELKKIKHTT